MSQSTADDDPLAVFPEPVEEGQRFGRYRLCYLLASGGMGSVYLARAEGPGGFEKLVALKRIHAHLARNARFVDMFLDEARIAARIQHPNVCSVIDFGEAEGSYYLTMPYIFGEPLHRVLRTAVRAAPSPRATLPWMGVRLVADACEGLHAAHELRDESGRPLDVVHRDVSPHNLMVGYDGGVRVLDFGVASARHRHYQTSTREVKGKFAYLAPEQIEGKRADRRADVWSLGVVLWESVTGRRLFHRRTMPATIQAVTHGEIPPLGTLEPAAPPGLEAVAARALARDAGRRYATAREMGRDLLNVLAEERELVGPADVAEWMAALFPSGRQQKERLAERSRVVALTPSERAAEEPTEPSGPPLQVVEPAADAAAPPATPGSESAARPERHAASTPPRSSPPIGLIAAFGAVAMLAIGLGIGGTLLWTSADEGGAPATATDLGVEGSPPGDAPEPDGPSPPAGATGAPAADEPPDETAENAPGSEGNEAPRAAAAHPPSGAPRSPSRPAEEPPEAPEREPADERTTARRGPSQPRGAGTVNVATPGGWGVVFLGRRRLGEAPGSFRVPAGTRVIGVQAFGEGPVRRRRVRVRPGRTAHLSVPVR